MSITLFLDLKFLESQLLQSLMLNDRFSFFLLFLTRFISFDPNTWDLSLVRKNSEIPKDSS